VPDLPLSRKSRLARKRIADGSNVLPVESACITIGEWHAEW
jgi:hypothetical protein